MAQPDTTFKIFEGPLKLPQLDMARVLEQQQRNLEATAKCWQVMAAGAIEVANRQRALFEAMVRGLGTSGLARPTNTSRHGKRPGAPGGLTPWRCARRPSACSSSRPSVRP